MRLAGASSIPVVPDGCLLIPLFPLGALMPSEQMPLRIFEPRYKQMLDDCILGDGLFGILPVNPDGGRIRGWAAPSSFGCITEINGLHEIGSNLHLMAIGMTRFELLEVLEPALDAEDFGESFPSVDELTELYVEDVPDGKLYLRGVVRPISPPVGSIDGERWNRLLVEWSKHIVEVGTTFGGIELDPLDILEQLSSTFGEPTPDSLFSVAASLVQDLDLQMIVLSSENLEDIADAIETSIRNGQARLRFIGRVIDDSEFFEEE
tara:strand:- start:440 stop:1231 length:792 start_codon:yes stop_codon:yes gene_type:complete